MYSIFAVAFKATFALNTEVCYCYFSLTLCLLLLNVLQKVKHYRDSFALSAPQSLSPSVVNHRQEEIMLFLFYCRSPHFSVLTISTLLCLHLYKCSLLCPSAVVPHLFFSVTSLFHLFSSSLVPYPEGEPAAAGGQHAPGAGEWRPGTWTSQQQDSSPQRPWQRKLKRKNASAIFLVNVTFGGCCCKESYQARVSCSNRSSTLQGRKSLFLKQEHKHNCELTLP